MVSGLDIGVFLPGVIKFAKRHVCHMQITEKSIGGVVMAELNTVTIRLISGTEGKSVGGKGRAEVDKIKDLSQIDDLGGTFYRIHLLHIVICQMPGGIVVGSIGVIVSGALVMNLPPSVRGTLQRVVFLESVVGILLPPDHLGTGQVAHHSVSEPGEAVKMSVRRQHGDISHNGTGVLRKIREKNLCIMQVRTQMI